MEPDLTEFAHDDGLVDNFAVAAVADHYIVSVLFTDNIHFTAAFREVGSGWDLISSCTLLGLLNFRRSILWSQERK